MSTPITSRKAAERTRTPRKAARTMGASRDLTTADAHAGAGRTALLDRAPSPRLGRASVAAPERPTRREQTAPTAPQRRPRSDEPHKNGRRLGSRQVVSVRGRRVSPIKNTGLLPKVSAIAITLLIAGIVLAMWLSGIATQQTFRINQLVAQESQLENQIETLNRDLQSVSSSAELARRANEMDMVVPQQPGILVREENGDITESRPAAGEVSPMIDINGEHIRPGQASSDPNETDELTDNLQAVPEGEQLPPSGSDRVPGVAPYSSGAARSAPAPENAPEAPAERADADRSPAPESEPAPDANPEPAGAQE